MKSPGFQDSDTMAVGRHWGGVMDNIQDYRTQESTCRKRALFDEKRKDMWLSMAQGWAYLANKEAAHRFIESSVTSSSDLADPKNRRRG